VINVAIAPSELGGIKKRCKNFYVLNVTTRNHGIQCNQCDQIGRNFAIWAIFLGVGRIFSEKYRPNDLGAIFSKILPKIHLNKL
jgi:prolipoprotein diacylglyceryltransferase